MNNLIDRFLNLYHTNLKTNIEKILFPIFFLILFFNFVPMMFGYSRSTSSDDSNPIDHAVQLKESLPANMALSSSITCMMPLLLDFLFDYFYYNEIFRNNDDYITSYNRNIILILLFLPDIYLLFIGIPFEFFDLNYCLCNARDILLTLYFLKKLFDFEHPAWNVWSYVFIALPSAINNLILSLSIMLKDTYTINVFTNITQVLSAISIFMVIIKTIQITMSLKSKINDVIILPKENIICAIQTYLFFIYFMVNWFVNLFPVNFVPYRWISVLGTNFFTMYTCAITLSFTVNYFIGYQLQRNESFQTKVIIMYRR